MSDPRADAAAELNDQVVSEIAKRRVTRALSSFEMKPVVWLWPGRIPYGKVTIIEGDPENAKSLLTLDVAARVSTGTPMPGEPGVRGVPRGVVIVCAEDDVEDTIAPRLAAAGADLDRIHVITVPVDDDGRPVPMSIPEDTDRVEAGIKEVDDAALLVIDPITAYLSETIQSHNDASVRRAMTPLADVAQRFGVAVILVRHLNKDTGKSAKHRGGGSIGFGGAARSVMVCAPHPDTPDLRVVARVKNNLSSYVISMGYRVQSNLEYDCPVIAWAGPVDIDADTLLRGKDSRLDAPERDRAVAFLRDVLADGPRPVRDVEELALTEGIKPETLKRARKKAGIVSEQKRTGDKIGAWHLRLPSVDDEVDVKLHLAPELEL